MKEKMCIASCIASIITITFIYLGILFELKNLLIYIISLLAYFLAYVLVIIFAKITLGRDKTKMSAIFCICFLGAMAILAINYIITGIPFYSFYGWSVLPRWIILGTIVLACYFSITTLLTGRGYGGGIYPVYIFAIISYAWSRYNPNIINADTYDADAYLTSIFNVYYNVPYSIETTGIYGHYGIFFKIPMMIFGGDIITISVMIAIIAAITMAAFSYSVNSLIRNNYVRILVIFAALLEPMYALPYSYYQTSPNRYIFPMLLLALISYDMKNRKKSNVWMGCGIACLGCLWNLESGLVVSVAWFIYLSIHELQNINGLKLRHMIRNVLMIPIELLLAIGIMGVYNILCGGSFEPTVFFYPFNHHLEDFALPLMWGNYAYIYVIPIFMSMFMWAVCNINKFDMHNKMAGTIGAISTMGIGLFSYYMNRFASCNVWMIVWEFALILGISVDKSIFHLIDIKRELKASIYIGTKLLLGIVSTCILSILAIGNIFSGGMQQALYEQGTKDIKQLNEWVNEIRDIVPENTYAVGEGTTALYSILGWDSGYHINDLPNLVARPEAYDRLMYDLYTKDKIFMANDSINLDSMVINGNFKIIYTFNFGHKVYYYLVKKE